MRIHILCPHMELHLPNDENPSPAVPPEVSPSESAVALTKKEHTKEELIAYLKKLKRKMKVLEDENSSLKDQQGSDVVAMSKQRAPAGCSGVEGGGGGDAGKGRASKGRGVTAAIE